MIPGDTPFNTEPVAVDRGLRSLGKSAAVQSDALFENALSMQNSISTGTNRTSSLNMRDGTFSNAQDDSANLGSTHSLTGKFSVTEHTSENVGTHSTKWRSDLSGGSHDASSWWSRSSSASESSAKLRTGSTRRSEWPSKQVNVNMKDKAPSSSGGVESSNWGRDSSNIRRVTASVSSENLRASDQFRGSAGIRSERNVTSFSKREQKPSSRPQEFSHSRTIGNSATSNAESISSSSWRDELSNNRIAEDTSFFTTNGSGSSNWGRGKPFKRRHLNGDTSLIVRNMDSIKTNKQHVNLINSSLKNSAIRHHARERNNQLMSNMQTIKVSSGIKSGSTSTGSSTSISSKFEGRGNSERSRTNILMQPSVIPEKNTVTETVMSSDSLEGFSVSGRHHLSAKLSDSNILAVSQRDRALTTTDRGILNRGSTHSNSPLMDEQPKPKEPPTEFHNRNLGGIVSVKHIQQGKISAPAVTGIARISGNQFAEVPFQPNNVQDIVTKSISNKTTVMNEQHHETPPASHVPSLFSKSSDASVTKINDSRVGIQPLRPASILLFRRNTSSSPVDGTSDENVVSDASHVKQSPGSISSIISIVNPGKRIVQNIPKVATPSTQPSQPSPAQIQTSFVSGANQNIQILPLVKDAVNMPPTGLAAMHPTKVLTAVRLVPASKDTFQNTFHTIPQEKVSVKNPFSGITIRQHRIGGNISASVAEISAPVQSHKSVSPSKTTSPLVQGNQQASTLRSSVTHLTPQAARPTVEQIVPGNKRQDSIQVAQNPFVILALAARSSPNHIQLTRTDVGDPFGGSAVDSNRFSWTVPF